MKEDAVVLLSGGQDSATCLYWARQEFNVVAAVSVNYGQRHAVELEAAHAIARMAGVPWHLFTLPVLGELADSALVAPARSVSEAHELGDAKAEGGTLPASFVPGRNALLLATAAAAAVKHRARHVVTGVCQTDYSGYPDCRREFIDAMERALTLAMPSSAGPIEIHTPLMKLTKAETVHLARGLPGCWDALALTVTCYNGQRPGCGSCPSCVLRAKGFAETGWSDPAA